MKILITGKNSYIGMSFEKWLNQWPDVYQVDTICLINDNWENYDFSQYDVVFHVAGIVHQKEKPGMKNLYFSINRDLAIEVAKKAKKSGVKQFIFMSSMAVYGLEGKIEEQVIINKNTPCNPNSFYGNSKLEAENEINKLGDYHFSIAIIRAPMVYGPNCPGNYKFLRKYARRIRILPDLKNQRSMIFINNLVEFIRLLIDHQDKGLFFPQNKEYVDTLNMAKIIAHFYGKKIFISKALGGLLRAGKNMFPIVNKIFGNLTYNKNLSQHYDWNYCKVGFEESIELTEKNKV
jgi:nucleoside-diphosphate-sugar epimerase